MMHFVRTFLFMRAQGVLLLKRFEIMDKLYKGTSKTCLKMAGGRMHTSHPTLLVPPQAISYRNHKKNLAYFSQFAPLVVFFFTKECSQKGGRAWPNASPLSTPLSIVATPDVFTSDLMFWTKFLMSDVLTY